MRRAVVSLTVLGSLALPAVAGAEIVPQESIKGVRLDMTVAEVRALLGGPDRYRIVRNDFVGEAREWRYGLTRLTFDGKGADAKVLAIETRSRAEKTEAGVGVGSSRAAVRRKVPGARCLVEFSYDHCFVGRWRVGQVITDFSIDRRGRVSRVVLGRVLD